MARFALNARSLAKQITAVVKDRRGLAAMEYGLIAGILAAAVVLAANTFSGKLQNMFNAITF